MVGQADRPVAPRQHENRGRMSTGKPESRSGLTGSASPVAGRFVVGRPVGISPQSLAYQGVDLTTGQMVFLRSVEARRLTPGTLARLEQEAAVLSRVASPYLVPLHFFGYDRDALWLAFDYIDEPTLRQRLLSNPLTLLESLAVFRGLIRGLGELHEHGLLHRAVRPDNVFLVRFGEGASIRLGGFDSPDASDLLRADQGAGPRLLEVASYLSPEQTGVVEEPISEASNIYSAGCILFECLAGRPPFFASSLTDLLHQQATRPAPRIRELAAGKRGAGIATPRIVDEILQRCLARDARMRYQSMEALAEDVDAVCAALASGEMDPDIPIGRRDVRRVLLEPALVARGGELAKLSAALRLAAEGTADVAFVEGPSGFGKSRLLSEFAAQAVQAGGVVFRGRATTEGSHEPLEVLEGVAAGFVSMTESRSDWGQQALARIRDDAEILSAVLPALSDVLTDGKGGESSAGSVGESRTLGALSRFLQALGSAETPAVVILDDVQWAADFVHRLLQHWHVLRESLGAEQRHVLLVIAFRTEEIAEGHPLRRIPTGTHIQLGALGRLDIQRLAESMAGPLPARALETVVALADGVPFMASAILYGLVETKTLIPGEGGWRVDEAALEQAGFASHAVSFLARRLDLLEPQTRKLLAVGSILGRGFDLKMAMMLAGLTPDEAFTAINEARLRHLVWWTFHDGHCTFVHDRIREAALRQQSPEEITQQHRKVALYLEREFPGRQAELAYHFDAAGEYDRALPHALESARQAHRSHSLELAEQQYRIARRGVTGAPRDLQFVIADGLGEVLMLRGKYDAAEAIFDVAAALAEGPAAEAVVRGKRGELCMKRGDMEGAAHEFENGLFVLGHAVPRSTPGLVVRLAKEFVVQAAHTLLPWFFVNRRKFPPSDIERLALRLYSGLSHACWYCRSQPLAMWAHFRGMNRAEIYPPTLELAQAYSNHAPAMTLVGAFRRAEKYVLRSLAIRRSFGDPWGEGQSYHYHGIVLYAAARYDECIQKCRQSIQILERMGDFWQVHIARYQIAACLYRLGNIEGALEESRRNYSSGITLGDGQASGIILDVWARAAAGNVPERILEEEIERERPDAQGRAQVLLAKAVQRIAGQQSEEAAQILIEAIRIVHEAGVDNPYVLPLYSWLARAWRTAAELDQSLTPDRRARCLRNAQSAIRMALRKSWRFRHELPHVYRELGLLQVMLGRPRRARKSLRRSLREATKQQARGEYLATLAAYSRVARELGWGGGTNLTDLGLEDLGADWMSESALPRLEQAYPAGGATLSLVDRFDNVLMTGRTIVSSLSPRTITREIVSAAQRLLRTEAVAFVRVDAEGTPVETGRDPRQRWNVRLITESARDRKIRIIEPSLLGGLGEGGHSVLCAPVLVRGEVFAVIHAAYPDSALRFGPDEERIAEFIGTLAGAAFENAGLRAARTAHRDSRGAGAGTNRRRGGAGQAARPDERGTRTDRRGTAADPGGAGRIQARGRGCQPRQEPVPGRNEPRDPHPDERDHRDVGACAVDRTDRPAAELPDDRRPVGQSPPGDAQ